MIEQLGLEGTLNITQLQPPAMGWLSPLIRLPRATSNLALSTSRDGEPAALWPAVPVPHGMDMDGASRGQIRQGQSPPCPTATSLLRERVLEVSDAVASTRHQPVLFCALKSKRATE